MSRFALLWYWQKQPLTDAWLEVYSFETEEYPRPHLVTGTDYPTTAKPWSYSSIDEGGRLVVHLPEGHLPDAPPMWYVLVREYGELRKTQSLVGFNTDHYPNGTVVELDELKQKGFEPSFMSQRIAAVRWGFGDPHLEQLFVSEDHRRKGVSTKIINVADIVNTAGNWGGFIYGGDQVTAMGQELSKAWNGSARVSPPKVTFQGKEN
jgi:hypothetical protein